MKKTDNWSYTWISRAKCWLRVYFMKYAPREIIVKDSMSGAAEDGIRVHKIFEDVLKGKKKLPAEYDHAKGLIQMLKAESTGSIYPEYALNIREDWTPTHGKDFDRCWLRLRFDALKINRSGTKAIVVDWKNGKRRVDETQLQLYAAVIFKLRDVYNDDSENPLTEAPEKWVMFKDIEVVNSMYYWTRTGEKDNMVFKYEDRRELWEPFEEFLSTRESNKQYNSWPPNPGFECRWCPCKDVCKYKNER